MRNGRYSPPPVSGCGRTGALRPLCSEGPILLWSSMSRLPIFHLSTASGFTLKPSCGWQSLEDRQKNDLRRSRRRGGATANDEIRPPGLPTSSTCRRRTGGAIGWSASAPASSNQIRTLLLERSAPASGAKADMREDRAKRRHRIGPSHLQYCSVICRRAASWGRAEVQWRTFWRSWPPCRDAIAKLLLGGLLWPLKLLIPNRVNTANTSTSGIAYWCQNSSAGSTFSWMD